MCFYLIVNMPLKCISFVAGSTAELQLPFSSLTWGVSASLGSREGILPVACSWIVMCLGRNRGKFKVILQIFIWDSKIHVTTSAVVKTLNWLKNMLYPTKGRKFEKVGNIKTPRKDISCGPSAP